MNKYIRIFLDSYLYDDTYEYDTDMGYYEDKVYNKFLSSYKNNIDYINFVNSVDINDYNVNIRIKREYDDRFGEFEFYGIIEFDYKKQDI